MKSFIKKNIKLVLAFILGAIIFGGGAYALTVGAGQITYDNTKSGIQATNVKDAIDELYAKAENGGGCSNGYVYDEESEDCLKASKVVFTGNGGLFSTDETNVVFYKAIDNQNSIKKGEYKVPEKTNYLLASWNTKEDGSGSSYETETDIKEALENGDNLVLYAQYLLPICRKATSTHSEQCTHAKNYSGTGNDCRYMYSQYYSVTYGHTSLTNGNMTTGYALDCDVNGDGVYNANSERFYYVSDYYDSNTNTFDNEYAALVYFSNTYDGVISTTQSSQWYSSNSVSYGPLVARDHLPTTEQWTNVQLKNKNRKIGSYVSSFSYDGYAARMLTYNEVYNGCSSGKTITSDGGLSNCEFLMERTGYTSSNYAYSYWLETPYSTSNIYTVNPVRLSLRYYSISPTGSGGVRPVIDVPKSRILLK